jgi:hypothetical protein
MIEKVAVSQALRAAFPKDFAGLYTAEEAEPAGYIADIIDADYHDALEDAQHYGNFYFGIRAVLFSTFKHQS